MNRRHQLRIANRMHTLLQVELGQGIDVTRMSAEPLYARDVLLVCDALPGDELPALAAAFRRAAAEPGPDDDDARGDKGGFRTSRFISSIFGMLSDAVATGSDASTLGGPNAPPSRPRRWFGRSRGPGK